MSIPNQDIEQMVEDAVAEQEETSGRDRTRGKTMYTRKALVKIFRMKKAEFEAFVEKDDMTGFEAAAVAHRNRCMSEKGIGTAALTLLRNTLGESVSVQKDTPEKGSGVIEIADDLPRGVRKQVN